MPTDVASTRSKETFKRTPKALTSRFGFSRKSISGPSTQPDTTEQNRRSQQQKIGGQGPLHAQLPSFVGTPASSRESSALNSPEQQTIGLVALHQPIAPHYPSDAVLQALPLSKTTLGAPPLASSRRPSLQVEYLRDMMGSRTPTSRRSSMNSSVAAVVDQGFLVDLPGLASMSATESERHESHWSASSSEFSLSSAVAPAQQARRNSFHPSTSNQPLLAPALHKTMALQRSLTASPSPLAAQSRDRDAIDSDMMTARRRKSNTITASHDAFAQVRAISSQATMKNEEAYSAPWLHADASHPSRMLAVGDSLDNRSSQRLRAASIRSHRTTTRSPPPPMQDRQAKRQLPPSPMLSQIALEEDNSRPPTSFTYERTVSSDVPTTLPVSRPRRSSARSRFPAFHAGETTMEAFHAKEGLSGDEDVQWEMINDLKATPLRNQRRQSRIEDKFNSIEQWRTTTEAPPSAGIDASPPDEMWDDTVVDLCIRLSTTLDQASGTAESNIASSKSELSIAPAESFKSMSSLAPSLFTALSASPKSPKLATLPSPHGLLSSSPRLFEQAARHRAGRANGAERSTESARDAIGARTSLASPNLSIGIEKQDGGLSKARQAVYNGTPSPKLTVMSDPNSEAFESAEEGQLSGSSPYAPPSDLSPRMKRPVLPDHAQKRVSRLFALSDRSMNSSDRTSEGKDTSLPQSSFALTTDQLLALSEEIEAGCLDTLELQRRLYDEQETSPSADRAQSDSLATPNLSRQSHFSFSREDDTLRTPKSTSWRSTELEPAQGEKYDPVFSQDGQLEPEGGPRIPASRSQLASPYPTRPARSRSRSQRISAEHGEGEGALSSSKATISLAFVKLAALPIQLVEPPTQTSWRSAQSVQVFEEFSDTFGGKEMHRQEVIEELRATERTFVVSINAILRIFSLPLRASDLTFQKHVPLEVARLFNCLDDILAFHVKVLRTMDKVKARHPSPLVVSVASAFHKHVPGLAVYQSYLVNFERVTRLIDDIRRSSNKGELSIFDDIIEQQSQMPECRGLSLSSFLLKPVQRLMKYPLFFKQLAELTPSDHPDYQDTQQLCAMTEKIIREMNCVKAREEDYQELTLLEKRIKGLPDGFHLASRQRRLLRQGSLLSTAVSEMDKWTESQNALERCPSATSSASVSPHMRPLELVSSANSSTSAPSKQTNGLLLLAPDLSRQSSAQSAQSSTWCLPPPERVADSKSMSNLSNASFGTMASITLDATKKIDDSQPPPRPATRKPNKVGLFNRVQSQGSRLLANLDAQDESVVLHAFVFDDMLLLATAEKVENPKSRVFPGRKKGTTLARTPNTSPVLQQQMLGDDQMQYNLLPRGGLSRILGVTGRSSKGDARGIVSVLEVEALPLHLVGERLRTSEGSGSLTFHFTFADGGKSSSTGGQEVCQLWERAFERSFMSCIQSRKRQSMLMHADMSSPLFAAIVPPQPASTTAQVDWLQRRQHVTNVVMNAAKCGDRTTLNALLQAGLPFPRSPSQQNLSDVANRAATDAERQNSRPANLSPHLNATESSYAPSLPPLHTPKTIRKSSSLSHLQSAKRSPGGGAAAAQSPRESIILSDVIQIGDLGNPATTALTLTEERKEEKAWWKLRLREIEVETNWDDEVQKLMGSRRSRVCMNDGGDAADSEFSPRFLKGQTGGGSTSKSTSNSVGPRVRRGLPVHKA